MGKKHLKRMAAPRTWRIGRKSPKLVIRPYGYLESALPVGLIMREFLNLTKSRMETRRVVNAQKVAVDGKTVRNDKLPAGLMSVVAIKGNGSFRVLLNNKGKLFLKELDSEESSVKPCKIISKKSLKGGKTQLGFHDGRTTLTDNKDAKVNDTVLFKLPEFSIEKHLKLEKNASVYLTGGSSVGRVGVVENAAVSVIVRIDNNIIETGKENVFVIGDETPSIKVN